MEIKDAKPCPRCGEKPTIIDFPLFARKYCACNNPHCEWYKLLVEEFSGKTEAWAVSRWNIHCVEKMKEEDSID